MICSISAREKYSASNVGRVWCVADNLTLSYVRMDPWVEDTLALQLTSALIKMITPSQKIMNFLYSARVSQSLQSDQMHRSAYQFLLILRSCIAFLYALDKGRTGSLPVRMHLRLKANVYIRDKVSFPILEIAKCFLPIWHTIRCCIYFCERLTVIS